VPPAAPADLEPGRLAAGAERRVGAPPNVARQQLLRALRELEFELRTEQFSLLEAVRGSRFGGVTLSAARVPVTLRVTLEVDGTATRVGVLLVDRWPGKMGRNWGVTSVYVELFESVLTAIDAVLGRLDAAAVASFAPWWRQTGPGDVAMMQNAANLANRAQAVLSRQASRLLDGESGQAQRQTMVSRTGGATFTFETAKAVAEVPAELADGMLMVGALIASRPGGMPPNLVAQVQSLVFRVEEHLAASAAAPGAVSRITVEPSDVPAVTFLHQQARLRGALPVRTLRTCTTCRLEKVTNPEMERLQERTRRTRDLATSLSAVVTPYVLAGRLVQMNSKNPEFTCPRCQGMDADETVVTYCQRCGDRRAETALRACPKCKFDFRSLVGEERLWRPRTEVAAPAPTAATGQQPTPGGNPPPPAPQAPGPPAAPPHALPPPPQAPVRPAAMPPPVPVGPYPPPVAQPPYVPASGPPQYGPPPGPPQYGPPPYVPAPGVPYGPPPYGSPQYGPPPGSPSYGPPQQYAPASGPPYGPPPGTPPHAPTPGSPQYGPQYGPPPGSPPYAPVYGPPPHIPPHAAPSHAAPHGVPPHGGPHGVPPHAAPHGVPPGGQPQQSPEGGPGQRPGPEAEQWPRPPGC
jgi:DNA-directed RNA polymerase subunit M/transcription elongation factor TFIIS